MFHRRDILVLLVLTLIALAASGGVYLGLFVRSGGMFTPTTPTSLPAPVKSVVTSTPTLPPDPTPTASPTDTPAPTPTALIQVVTVIATVPTSTPLPPTPTPRPGLQELGYGAARSLVKLAVLGDGEDDRSGSGSIVDGEKGLILTNWHIVGDDSGDLLNQEGVVGVLWTKDPDQDPDLAFMARVLPEFSDPVHDLAILQITHKVVESEPIAVQWPLDLPPVPLGDSTDVYLGDPILLLGYPDYTDGIVSWTEGHVTAHSDEWIMSDSLVSHGHSGGMMLNGKGQLIGVASEIQWVGWKGELVKARPINIASPLIEQAKLDAIPPPAGSDPTIFREPEGELMAVLGAADVPLRDGPGANSREIGRLAQGTSVEVLGDPALEGERYWYHVQPLDGGTAGWVRDNSLVSSEAASRPILFTSTRAGSEDLYGIHLDGTTPEALTDIAGSERDPSRSPDGDYVVFVYTIHGSGDLFAMDASGSRPLQLTDGPADDAHPAWSPDGRSIALVSNRDGDWDLYILDLYHQELRQLTFNQSWDGFPSWSPDGRKLAFASDRTGNYDLFLVDVSSGEEQQLTSNPHPDTHPSWAPQGSEIAYTMGVSMGEALRTTIAVLDIRDPDHPRHLTTGGADQASQRFPDWSPDGRWIVFVSEQEDGSQINLVLARGGSPIILAGALEFEPMAPAWSR